jgi:hypothetical protein
MKYFILFTFLTIKVYSQNKDLDLLLQERRQLYNDWKNSLEKKTGIFRNQNKADLTQIIEVLKQIIKKDNEIVDLLETKQIAEYQSLQENYNILIEENAKLLKLKTGLEKKLAQANEFQNANHTQIERSEGDKLVLGFIAFILTCLIFVLYLLLSTAKRKVKSLEKIIKSKEI